MQFIEDSLVDQKVANAIALTGIARSGTTVMGKLFNSLKNVEYGFEPSILVRLFFLLGHIPDEAWKSLYQVSLYQGILMDSLAGRALNFNSNDDSYIFGAKSVSEIAKRFQGENRHKEIFKRAHDIGIAYKIPDIIEALPDLQRLYPQTRILVMLRSPDAVVLSLKRKGWFLREVPLFSESGLLKVVNGYTVPAIVEDDNVPRWKGLSETDRCYVFYHQVYRSLHKVKGAVVVDFDRFVDAPVEMFQTILDRFGLENGERTPEILQEIAEPHGEYPPPADVTPSLRAEAWDLYQECRKLAL